MKCDCERKCRCEVPVIGVEEIPDNLAMLKFNFDGVSTLYDYRNMIEQIQTDTTLTADSIKRVLNYMAERHTDTISAKELGSILHLADIADINITDVENYSMLIYKKDSDCSQGCEGINNSWAGWNANNNQNTSVQTVMGFDQDSRPYALQAPANANQYYQLGWNAGNKAGYSQPVETTVAAVTDSDSKVSMVVVDPITKQLKTVKVAASKLQAMTEA